MIELRIQMLSFWHPGTGRGQGPGADAEANRDTVGLPQVPGRTLKGLLREAAETAAALGQVEGVEVSTLFGSAFSGPEVDTGPDPARHQSRQGTLSIYSAHLGRTAAEVPQWQAWGQSDKNHSKVRHLFRTIASTKLEDGVAADHSLRSVEVVVPVHLTARVECSDLPAATRVLQAAAPYVSALGAHRTRGLGRCIVTVWTGGQ